MPKSENESKTKSRLQSILRGAFAGSPTPLKDIPTKEGESRAVKKRKTKPKRRGKYG
jgi:hypothetical protein